jgi:hypothetical protein
LRSTQFPAQQKPPPLHAVLSGPAVFEQRPGDGSQESVVQRLPSLQSGGGPPRQVPPWQTSPVVQAFPSLHEAVLFVLMQPAAGLQASSVQTLPSLQLGGVLPTQVPPAQTSTVVQALPSLHAAELFVLKQPLAGLQASSVQTLPSLQLGGVLPTQEPPLQTSTVVQALPSEQAVPSGLAVLEQTPVAGSQVPAEWHWSEPVQTTLPCVQEPAAQESFVQALPSSQETAQPPQWFESMLKLTSQPSLMTPLQSPRPALQTQV